MIDMRILVIDDEVIERLDTYDAAATKLSQLNETISFAFDYSEDGPDALEKLSSHRYDFIILDVVLTKKRWLKGISFSAICKQIDGHAPFFLVTSKFDVTNRDVFYDAMGTKGYVTLLRWSDFEQIEESASFLYQTMLHEKKELQVSLEIEKGPCDDITILQLSDIQIGGYPSTEDKFEAQITAASIKALIGNNSPDFVVIPGDLAQHATPLQYAGAREWLVHLFKQIEFPYFKTERLLMVPGNHDVNLALGTAGHLKYLGKQAEISNPEKPAIEIKDDAFVSDLTRHAYTPYREFERSLVLRNTRLENSSPEEFPLSWVENSFGPLGLLFFGLNTARPLVSGKEPRRKVSEDEVAELTGWLSKNNDTIESQLGISGFSIGLLHHSPIGNTKDKSIENDDVMKKFFNHAAHTQLIFTGHVHEGAFDLHTSTAAGRGTIISTSSTATLRSDARAEDTSRGFNFVILKRKDSEVVAVEGYQFIWSTEGLEPRIKKVFKKQGHTFVLES